MSRDLGAPLTVWEAHKAYSSVETVVFHEATRIAHPIVYDGATMRALTALKSDVKTLTLRIAALEDAIHEIRKSIDLDNLPPEICLREDEDDKRMLSEVKEYFAARDGEVIYPSDVAGEFGIRYERATALIESLASNGQIKKA